mmetsp:Transcript_11044/g.24314  ORF Transcript_11044/g.24314 Transcript_11044/m.24314 type:complete len:87 (-) Transcript_11044:34-294(-)
MRADMSAESWFCVCSFVFTTSNGLNTIDVKVIAQDAAAISQTTKGGLPLEAVVAVALGDAAAAAVEEEAEQPEEAMELLVVDIAIK